jgi:hypothetical protein
MMTLAQELANLPNHSEDLDTSIDNFLKRTIESAIEEFGRSAVGPWTAIALWTRRPSKQRTCITLRDALLQTMRLRRGLSSPHEIKIKRSLSAVKHGPSGDNELDLSLEHDLSPGDDPKDA